MLAALSALQASLVRPAAARPVHLLDERLASVALAATDLERLGVRDQCDFSVVGCLGRLHAGKSTVLNALDTDRGLGVSGPFAVASPAAVCLNAPMSLGMAAHITTQQPPPSPGAGSG